MSGVERRKAAQATAAPTLDMQRCAAIVASAGIWEDEVCAGRMGETRRGGASGGGSVCVCEA